MKTQGNGRALLAAWLTVLLTAFASVRAADDPFAWPPVTAQQKPWAYNWWLGSAVDKTNLTHELERYAAAGLGGIHIIPIYGAKGFEDKYINYLSPQWMEMMGWAVSEARRLGMDVDMTTGSGWCFGGPQVTDEDANANVVVRVIEVEKDKAWKMPADLKGVQAFVVFSPDGKSHDLTSLVTDPTKDFDWSPAPGDKIYIVSQKPSGQKVKRAGPGGEGWMLNLIYPPAMDDFLKPYTDAFANYHGPKPRAQYHDSYEYRSDWSPNFFAEFEKRHGYKLQAELPALFSGLRFNDSTIPQFSNPDHANRVKCDYRQTVSEIIAEESLPKWVNWSHDHGFITRNQAHGSPGNWLDLYAAADIPETEMFHSDRNKLISKFASSAAHVTGKPLVSAETGTWLEEHFTEKLFDVKYLLDDLFLSGVNHAFYHGCCYSPDEAGWPGWHFYASLEMNPRNSIWRDVPALNAYAARVQSILQSGQPDNDILLYWPIADFWMQPGDKLLPQLTVHARDWFEGQPLGKTAKELWDKGYAFDYVSDAQLKTAKVEDRQIENRFGTFHKSIIQMPGAQYETIVVPECKYIPIETFRQLFALAEKGATVIFEQNIPTDVPGLKDLEANRKELRQVVSGLKSVTNNNRYNAGYEGYPIGKGWFYTAGTSFSGLKVLGLGDFDIPIPRQAPPLEETGLSFVRRASESGWNYFIVNCTETNFDGRIGFLRPIESVVAFDPMTGVSGIPTVSHSLPSVTRAQEPFASSITMRLKLDAGQSLILHTFATNQFSARELWTRNLEATHRRYYYWQTNGQPIEITGQWNVKFLEGGPTLPADFQTPKLASWTTFPDTNTQTFAGTAKYESTFDLPNPQSAIRNPQCFLDLGDVRQSARVRVNDKDCGTLITPPFRVVVDNLKPTGNTLELEVTSVAANRIRDLDRRGVPWKTFRDINLVDINYKPFDASNWPLTDCGLLGPVTLTPVTSK